MSESVVSIVSNDISSTDFKIVLYETQEFPVKLKYHAYRDLQQGNWSR